MWLSPQKILFWGDIFSPFAGVIAVMFKFTGLGYIAIIFFNIRIDCWKRKG
jgi:hypothetical protein